MKKLNYYNLCLAVSTILLSTGLISQDTCEVERKLVAADAQAVEYLGGHNGVDISGNYAIVGAIGNNDLDNLAGAAHIFQKQGSEWVEIQEIKASDGSFNDRFGKSVAIWDDYAIVGAPFDDINGQFSGSAFVFHRIGQSWIQEFKISPLDGLASDRFGWGVDIWEDYIVVTSLNDYTESQTSSGSAYFFKREGDEWIEINKVSPMDGGNFDEFGASISMKDNLALIGSAMHDENGTNSGAAYLYAYQDSAWVFMEKIVASDASAGAQFGYSVSVSDSLATIGANHDIFNDVDTTGAVYVYRQNDLGWEEVQKIITPETTFNLEFGRSNAHFGDRLIIGTTKANTVGVAKSGAIFLYEYNGTAYEYQRKLTANDAENLDFYSASVSMEGDFIIVGAPREDSNGGDAGAAYIHFIECNPVCTTISSPIDGGVGVPLDENISWYPVDNATGYFMSVGTSSGAVDVLDNMDVGDVTIFDLPNDLTVDTEYFINITPYNEAGNSTDCIESSFTTEVIPMILNVGADVTIPCYEPVPTPTYIVNNICGEATVEVSSETIPGDCEAEYTIIRTYTATDGCTTISDIQTIIIDDMDGPEILSAPEDVVVACGDALPTDEPIGEDECSSLDISVTYVDTPEPSCGMVIERVFSVMDACGNVTNVTQLITIESSDGLPSCTFLDAPSGVENPLDVSLVWTEATDALGYILSVGTTSGGTDVVDSMDVDNVLTFDLTGLTEGTTYFVTVIPYNEVGSAAFCSEFEFTTASLPDCSTSLELPDESPVIPVNVILQWTASTNANGYILSVGTTSGGTDITDNLDVMDVLNYEFETLPVLSMIYVTITPYNDLGNAEECTEFSFETTEPEGIEEIKNRKNISIYPNPSNGLAFSISFENTVMARSTEEIIIFDALGKTVAHFVDLRIEDTMFNVNMISELKAGVYSVSIKTSTGIYRKSLVVE